MNWSASMFLVGALAVGAPVWAAPAGPTTGDYAKEIQVAAADEAPAAQTGACENGEQRDASGACPVVDDSAAQRGFTLFSGSMAKPQAQTPVQHTATANVVKDVKASQPAAMRCGLLCDLKVNFKPGSSELTHDSEAKLEQFAVALRDPTLARKRFEIGGHTDASGSAEKNLALSQARAESVKAFLVKQGVEASRLQARGYGAEGLAVPSQPLDPRNRRVEARALN